MTNIKGENMTVAQLFEEWLELKRPTISASTIKLYDYYYSKFVADRYGHIKVNDIDPDEWNEFEQELRRETSVNGQTLSRSTARQAVSMYHTVFGYGRTEYGLNDPTEDLVRQDYYDNDPVVTFTRDEVKKLRAAAKPYDVYHLCVMIGLYTGITYNEICALQWGDIDTENRLIKIRRVITRSTSPEGGPKLIFKAAPPKNKKAVRDLPLPDWIADQLEAMKPMHEDNEFVVVGPLGEIQPNNFRVHYMNFLKKAGVSYRLVNALRHTFAVTCIEKGIDLKSLSEMLGHANIYVTIRKYMDTDEASRRRKLAELYD